VGPGHCYRLYSSSVFTNVLPQFAESEIRPEP
jgi:HrpA-like RNA helicase